MIKTIHSEIDERVTEIRYNNKRFIEEKIGEWKHLGGDEWVCSSCGNVIFTEGSWEKPYERDMFFCNKCGADMRERRGK